MNDSTNEPIGDTASDDLVTRFAATRRTQTSAAVEADLGAVHDRARQVHRRRVFGGTAAAALLVTGGGALAVTSSSDEEPTVAVQAATDVAVDPAAERTTTPSTIAPEPDAAPEDDASTQKPSFTDFPVPDLPPLPDRTTDGDTDWSGYVDELTAALTAWTTELGVWLEANPEVSTWIDVKGPLGGLDGPFLDLDITTWLKDLDIDEWKAQLDDLDIDLDAWLKDLDLDARLSDLDAELDGQDFDLDAWLDGLDIDRWKTQLDAGEIDIDRWLEDLGLGGEAGLPALPDLGELSQFDPELVDVDQWFDDLDLSDVGLPELDGLDLSDLDLGSGELPEFDLRELLDRFGERGEGLDALLDGIFGTD
ncbi:MAG: hypothetical protein AAGG08_02350 [Actinomycetota bacterium]